MGSSYRIFKSCRLILTMTLLVIIFMLIQTNNIIAEKDSPIEISVESGFNNEFKASDFIPLTVTVKNRGQEDIEGFISVDININNTTYYKEIILPKNTTKSIILNVPGEGVRPDTKVRFYQNDTLLAETKIGGVDLSPNTLFIGVLASDNNTGNFIYTIPKDKISNPINIAHISNYDSFNSLKSLMLLDILIINNFSFDSFNQNQIDNIIKWTEQGGSLILAGGSHYTKLDERLIDLSPVKFNNIKQINNLSGLETNVGTPIKLQSPFSVSDATVKNGDVLVSQNDLPLFVLNEYNQGKILYVAYDINEEPVASWSGNKELWAYVIEKLDLQLPANEKNYQINNNWWSLNNAASRIPSLELPELNKLIVLFSAYILIIGPILYFVLRRFDRRDTAWYIIPLTAVILAVGIFQFSLVNKGKDIIVNNVSILELHESQNSKLITASSVFAPKAGDYKVKYKNVNNYLPTSNSNNNSSNRSGETLVSFEQDNVDLTYKNMDYWSYRSSYIETDVKETGSFISNLHIDGKMLIGTITNETNYSLRDVKFVAGGNVENIGDFKVNETKSVSINYDVDGLKNIQKGFNVENLLPDNIINSQDRYSSRERHILDYLFYDRMENFNYGLFLIGWNEEELIDYELGNSYIDYNLTLVKAGLDIKPNNEGYVTFIPNSTKPKLISESNDYDTTNEGYFVGKGSYVFEFNLKELSNISVDKMKFFIWSYDRYTFDKQIYNWATKSYEGFSSIMQNDTLQSENINDYLFDKKKVRILINNDSSNRIHLGAPAILIEGSVE